MFVTRLMVIFRRFFIFSEVINFGWAVFMRTKSLLSSDNNKRILIMSIAREHRLNGLAELLERNLGVSVNIKSTNDRYQLSLNRLMSHLLQK